MIDEGTLIGVDEYWTGDWRGPTVFAVRDGVLVPAPGERAQVHLPGTLFPRLTDHHVHLGLIDPEGLMDGGITAVVDLGWIPEQAAAWHTESGYPGSTLPEVRIAGGFLTCVGGYPFGRQWAPRAATVEIADPSHAEAAVRAQIALGATVIKTTLSSVAGPVPSTELLQAIVLAARSHGIPVAAHVEGEGMTLRALDAGVNILAHTPFTELIDADLRARMSRAGTAVISTLDIHGWGEPTEAFAIASENLQHLAASGARIRYGTDLGNGDLPLGVNVRELTAMADAGLDRDTIVTAIAGRSHPATVGPRFAWAPGLPPETAAETGPWLAAARGTTVDYLEETLV